MTAVNLRRVDPVRNMSRFYRLDVQPDLFGHVLLVAERYNDEALAADALQRQAELRMLRTITATNSLNAVA